LIDVWYDLREYYYSNTTKESYENFKDRFREIIQLENLIDTCKYQEDKIKQGLNVGHDVFEYFEIDSEDLDDIHRSILKKETELDLIKAADRTNDKVQQANYDEFIGTINLQLPYQINTKKTTLYDFCGTYKSLISKQKMEKAIYEKNKNKR
jgi:hypothetical protein